MSVGAQGLADEPAGPRQGGVVEGQSERRWTTGPEAHSIEIVASQAAVANDNGSKPRGHVPIAASRPFFVPRSIPSSRQISAKSLTVLLPP